MAMSLGSAAYELTVDRSKFDSGLRDAESAAKRSTSAIGSAFGGLGAAFAAPLKGLAGLATEIAKVGSLAIGGGLVAGLGGAVTAAAGFEKTMSAVGAVSGATAAEMKALSSTALQIGKDTQFGAAEAAAGIEELVKAGVSIEDVLGGAAAAAADLAAASGTDLATAAEIASGAMNNFGKTGADMANVANTITGAVNASAIDINDFKFSMAAVGAVANTVGVSMEDTATAIALLGQAGIKGSDAGTSLKTMLLSLQPTTVKQSEEFARLGLTVTNTSRVMEELIKRGVDPAVAALEDNEQQLFKLITGWNGVGKVTKEQQATWEAAQKSLGLVSNSFFTAEGKAKSLAEISGVLQDATKGMTDQQKLASLELLFGTDAIRAAAVMAKEGAAGFGEMTDAMAKQGDAQRIARERLNNLSGSLEQLKGSLETAAITVGLALTPALKGLTDLATGALNNAMPSIEAFAGALGELIRTGDMRAFAAAFRQLTGLDLSGLIAFGGFVRDTLLPALAALGDAAIKALGGDFAGALVGLSGLVKDFGPDLADQLGAWAEAFLSWVEPLIPPLLGQLVELGSRVNLWIYGTALPALIEQLSRWAAAFVDWVAPQIPPLLRELGNLLSQLGAWLETTGLAAISAKLAEWGTAFVEWVAPRIPPLLLELGKLLLELNTWAIKTALPAISGKLGEWALAFLKWIYAPPDGVIWQLPGALARILTAIGDWLKDTALPWLGRELPKLGAAMVADIQAGIGGALAGFKQWLTDNLLSAIPQWARDILGIKSPSSVFVEIGANLVKGFQRGILREWPSAEELVKRLFGGSGLGKTISWGMGQIGKPYSGPIVGEPESYRWGEPGWDCSSFVSGAYRQIGLSIPAFTDSAAAASSVISQAAAIPGDMLFWRYNDPTQGGVRYPHMGLYLGTDRTLDARFGRGVGIGGWLNAPAEIRRANALGFAEGGVAWRKQLAWVGEKEPELIVPFSKLGLSRSAAMGHIRQPTLLDGLARGGADSWGGSDYGTHPGLRGTEDVIELAAEVARLIGPRVHNEFNGYECPDILRMVKEEERRERFRERLR
jgi:cell wall-associated NlpC family hydrolase